LNVYPQVDAFGDVSVYDPLTPRGYVIGGGP
jgi:hypothetical protein